MKRKHRETQLITSARRKQNQIERRLKSFQEEFGNPLPTWLADDATILRLSREIVEIEYELYGLNPGLTAEQLYVTDLSIEDYFRHDRTD